MLIIVFFPAFFKVISSDSSSSIDGQDDAVIVEHDDFVEVFHYVSSFINRASLLYHLISRKEKKLS